MSVWLVPAALAAVGVLPAVAVALRVRAELAGLRRDLVRVAALRPAVRELAGDVRAVSGHVERLSRRR